MTIDPSCQRERHRMHPWWEDPTMITTIPQVGGTVRVLYAISPGEALDARQILRHDPAMVDHLGDLVHRVVDLCAATWAEDRYCPYPDEYHDHVCRRGAEAHRTHVCRHCLETLTPFAWLAQARSAS